VKLLIPADDKKQKIIINKPQENHPLCRRKNFIIHEGNSIPTFFMRFSFNS